MLFFSFSLSVNDEYYEILGVPKDATFDEIKAAYKRLALKWHPDRHKDSVDRENAHKQFIKISEAYHKLKAAYTGQSSDEDNEEWFEFGDDKFHFRANYEFIEELISKVNVDQLFFFLYLIVGIMLIFCIFSIYGCCMCFYNVFCCLCKRKKVKVN